MADFFEFDDTDNFLGSISGVLDVPMGDGSDKAFDANAVDLWKADLQDNGFNNGGTYGDSLFGDIKPVNLESTSMSMHSYSQESSSNGISPHTQHSVSSSLTSPENLSDKDVTVKNLKIENDNLSPGESESKVKESTKGSKITKPMKKDKVSHNMIEKKYRTNINSKILALRDAVPSLRIAAGGNNVSMADLEGLTPASKLNKASVLTKATEYIKHLEKKNEILRNQNLRLQQLIQQANSSPSNNSRFGFMPQQEQSYNVVPSQDQYYSPTDSQNMHLAQQPQYQQQGNNKYLMGGMAAVVGTTLLGGSDGEFQGLSALPFSFLLPNSILYPSPVVIQLWYLFKIVLLAATAYQLFLPSIKSLPGGKDKGGRTRTPFENYLLVRLGFKLPLQITPQRRSEILDSLLGKTQSSWWDVFNYYLELSVSEINFENCFLDLLIGKLLIYNFPRAEILLRRNLSIKAGLIMNLGHKDEKSGFHAVKKLIDKVDGLSFMGSEPLLRRLSNLIDHKTINAGVSDGQNHMRYIEIYNQHKDEFCKLFFEWRMLEIVYCLNIRYLEILAEEDASSERIEELQEDLSKIKKLISPDSTVEKSYNILLAIVNPENSIYLMDKLSSRVFKILKNFGMVLNGQELTDDEVISNSEEESDEEKELEPETVVSSRKNEKIRILDSDSLKSKKKLIADLNLVSQDEVIALVCSTALLLWNQNKSTEANKVLKYINVKNYKLLSLSNIASLAALFNTLIPGVNVGDSIDSLLKLAKQWADSSNLSESLNNELRSNLSNMIYDKTMVYNKAIDDEEY